MTCDTDLHPIFEVRGGPNAHPLRFMTWYKFAQGCVQTAVRERVVMGGTASMRKGTEVNVHRSHWVAP